MDKIFKQDNIFFEIMSRIGDLVLLNLLWILTSLPILTIGASTSSLFYTSRKILDNRDASLVKNYFKSFKENFINATILWIPLFIIGLLLFLSANTLLSGGIVATSLFTFLLLLYLVELIYVFALQATFINTPLHILKNAFLTAFGHIKVSFFTFAITYIPMSLTLLFPSYFYLTFVLWVCIGFSLTSLAQAYILNFVLKEYIDEE